MRRFPWHRRLEAERGRPKIPQSFGPLQHRNCPLCGGLKYRSVLENQFYPLAELDVMSVVECMSCSFLFTNPIPSAEWYETFLDPKVNVWWDDRVWMTEQWQEKTSSEKFSDGLGIIQSIIPRGRILDVGTGPGLFVRMAIDAGYAAIGFDILPQGVESAEADNIPVVWGKSLSSAFTGDFDIVTMWCVIAHEPNCVDLVKDCYKLLKPGGMVLVETPNMTLWKLLRKPRTALRVLGLKAFSHDELGAYGHINHFTTVTLRHLLRKTGFQDIQFHMIRNYSDQRGLIDTGKRLLYTVSGSRINFCFPMVATGRK